MPYLYEASRWSSLSISSVILSTFCWNIFCSDLLCENSWNTLISLYIVLLFSFCCSPGLFPSFDGFVSVRPLRWMLRNIFRKFHFAQELWQTLEGVLFRLCNFQFSRCVFWTCCLIGGIYWSSSFSSRFCCLISNSVFLWSSSCKLSVSV